MMATASVVAAERDLYRTIEFEETELRLGLPGGGGGGGNEGEVGKSGVGKRGFEETESGVDLKLNLAMVSETAAGKSGNERKMKEKNEKEKEKEKEKVSGADPARPPASKAQVVGWPPVRSFRKNAMAVQKNSSDDAEKTASSSSVAFVKVSMDGAPYLRKVDLKQYKSYQELSGALSKMFSSFTIGSCGSDGAKSFSNESKLIDLLSGSDYVPTFEDKDGDWMLVGDVPWEMFVDSCKRMRIMKGSEAVGLAPRSVERRSKNRS